MAILVDTCVLLRLHDPGGPQYDDCDYYIDPAVVTLLDLRCCTQNLIEYWAVATRPIQNNGLGLPPALARQALDRLLSVLPLLPEPSCIASKWLDLVTRYGVSGKTTHDARLVALMDESGIDQLLTLNLSDFRRFSHIRLIDPATRKHEP